MQLGRVNPEMNLKVWGPICFAAMLFVISNVIKIVAFANSTFFMNIGSEFALCSMGILFSLSISEQRLLEGRTKSIFRQKESGTGIEIEYIALPPNRIDFNTPYLYFFVYSMMIWISTIVFTEKAHILYSLQKDYNLTIICFAILTILLAASSLGLAIRSLKEVLS
jgi:hypothetical protein